MNNIASPHNVTELFPSLAKHVYNDSMITLSFLRQGAQHQSNQRKRQLQYKAPTHAQSGQVALIILLIMVVVLTLGVSLASRTVMDVTLTRQEEQGGRVYQAAESGVESALNADLANDALYTNDAFTGTLNSISDIDVNYSVARKKTLETRVGEGGAVAVDVTGTANGNQLAINWGKGKDCNGASPADNAASLLIRVYNVTGGVTTVKQYAYAACTYTNGYPVTGTLVGDNGYYRKVLITLATGDKAVRVQPVYADTYLQVDGVGWTLPVQYYAITSNARNQLGNETKAIQVSRTLPTFPGIMDYALYSGTTIVK